MVRFRWFDLKFNFSLFFYKNKEKRKGKKAKLSNAPDQMPKSDELELGSVSSMLLGSN